MMAVAQSVLWQERLQLPAYRVGEAARYAGTSPQTVINWQKARGERLAALATREHGHGLSYLQLIEVGVVSAMRKAGVSLRTISDAREYLAVEFKSEFPFAQYRFKTDGKSLFVNYDEMAGPSGIGKLLVANKKGQLAWTAILSSRLSEFEYDKGLGTVLRWKVGGGESPVRIDPRVAFGAPQVNGIPTWVLKERWHSGESVADIADDYDLKELAVEAALRFEGIEVDPDRPALWMH